MIVWFKVYTGFGSRVDIIAEVKLKPVVLSEQGTAMSACGKASSWRGAGSHFFAAC